MDYNIGQAFAQVEEYLIDSMMRNFKHHRAEETKEGINWTQWQAEQLKALEQYRQNNSEKFTDFFADINSKVEEMIIKARADGNAEQEIEILEAIKKGFIPPDKPSATATGEFFKVNDKKLNALIKSTTDDLQKAEHAVLRMAEDKYRQSIFNAQVAMNTGAVTYEQAVDIACRDMLRAGLNCVEYKNGARHTLEDYADMAIKTANKRAYLRGEGEKRQEWGITTVVVNSRQGGCPDCAKFIGKVFIDDVYSGGKKSDGNYPLLSSAIELGLFHPRCKDSTSTYYEDITTLDPELSEWELKDLEEIEKLEQQKMYALNEAKKCMRIATYSLDATNKMIYQKRAEDWNKKADEINENITKSVAKSGESGIIKTKRNISKSVEIPSDCEYLLKSDTNFEDKNISEDVLITINNTIRKQTEIKSDFNFDEIKIAKFSEGDKSIFITNMESMGTRSRTQLYLNKEYFIGVSKSDLDLECEKLAENGWWKSKSLDDLVNHEIMHARINYYNSYEKVEQLYQFLGEDKRVIGFCDLVDKYPSEFLNEMYVAINNGTKVDEKYMIVYNEYIKKYLR